MSFKKIVVENLSSHFGKKEVLKNINIDFPLNQITAIIGPSGSGKSVLLEHLNGILIPSSGSVRVDDFFFDKKKKKFSYIKKVRKKIGFLFQFPEKQLFKDTVQEDIIFGPLNFGFSREEAIKSAKKYLDFFRVPQSFMKRSPFELSGGEKRKVAICGIFSYEPNIILVDQPTRGLDVHTSKNLLELIFKFKNELKKTIIFAGQNSSEILELADNVIVLEKGEIIEKTDVFALFNNSRLCERIGLNLPKTFSFLKELKKGKFFESDIFFRSEKNLIKGIVQRAKELVS